MSIIARQSIKGTIASYAGALIGAINILFLFPLIDKEILGLYKVLLDASLLIIVFADLGVSQSIVRYFPYFRNEQSRHNGFLPQVLFITAVGFFVLSLLFILFQKPLIAFYTENSPLFAKHFLWVLPISFGLLFMGTLSAYVQSLMRITVPQLIRELGIRLCTSLLILMMIYQWIQADQFVLGLSVAHLLALVVLMGYIFYLKQLHLKPAPGHFDRKRFSEMLQYGLWNVLGSGGSAMILRIDTIMLASMSGLKDTGIYALAQFIGSMIEIPYRSLSKMASSRVAQLFKEGDTAGIGRLYKKSSDNNFLIGGMLFLLIWCNIDSLFQIIPKGETFKDGIWVVFFIALAKLVDMSLGINAEILSNSRRYRWGLIIQASLAVLTVLLNLWLIPKYNIMGAALSLFITTNLYNLLRYFVILKFFGMQPLSVNSLKIVLIFSFALLIGLYLPSLVHPILDLLYRSVILMIVFIAPAYRLNISPELFEAVRKFISKKST